MGVSEINVRTLRDVILQTEVSDPRTGTIQRKVGDFSIE